MALLDIIAGARPNFMKIAPLVKALDTYQCSQKIKYRIIHTGQHYSPEMSRVFFEQLGLPKPMVNLNVGSGTQSEQTAAIMIGYEKLLMEAPSDMCIVVGDVNSTLACAITAQKLCIPVAHIEGGIRSGDWTMPEEINRLVTDSISSYFFTTSHFANANLKKSGVDNDRIFFVGNTMIDTLIENAPRMQPPVFWEPLKLVKNDYFLLTLHRPANVDSLDRLGALVEAICAASRGKKVVFPAHPRTQNRLMQIQNLPSNLHTVEPQPYLQFGYLAKRALAVLTDSGGVTEEATYNGVPCVTFRNNTERPETVTVGTNVLAGTDLLNIKPLFDSILDGKWKTGSIPELWDGKAGCRIARALDTIL